MSDMIRELEALVVGPDEVLIIKVSGEPHDDAAEEIAKALHRVGLGGRSLVFLGDIEFTKVQQPLAKGETR